MSSRSASAAAGSELETIASVVERLAVLLAAGVPPASGWRYLAEQGDSRSGEWLKEVADAADGGHSIADTVAARVEAVRSGDAGAWRGLAAAWSIATDSGAPLAPTLRQLASSLRSLAQTQRDIAVALTAPAATARVVTLLPPLGMLFGMVLGFDPLGTLLATAPGWICLATGLALVVAARAWNRRLIRRATPMVATPGLSLDLLAIAVSGGAPIEKAVGAVGEVCERFGIDHDEPAAAAGILSLSSRAGVPAAALLHSEAEQVRRLARNAGQRSAALLSVTLMLPLGLCILPAFVLLGVAPLVLAVISSTVSTF
ncbi:MAG: type II secretion system F family protein [Microbacteriaceae bacterium]